MFTKQGFSVGAFWTVEYIVPDCIMTLLSFNLVLCQNDHVIVTDNFVFETKILQLKNENEDIWILTFYEN